MEHTAMFNFRTFIPALAIAATLGSVAAAQSQAIRFQNNSGATVYRIYASPVTNGSWENDLLGSNVLTSGRFLDVTIHNVSECNYDLLVQFENGAEFTDVVNICQIGQYNIN
jgi:hypothetical protein